VYAIVCLSVRGDEPADAVTSRRMLLHYALDDDNNNDDDDDNGDRDRDNDYMSSSTTDNAGRRYQSQFEHVEWLCGI